MNFDLYYTHIIHWLQSLKADKIMIGIMFIKIVKFFLLCDYRLICERACQDI